VTDGVTEVTKRKSVKYQVAMVINAVWAVTPRSLVVITYVPTPIAFLHIHKSPSYWLTLPTSRHTLSATCAVLSSHALFFYPEYWIIYHSTQRHILGVDGRIILKYIFKKLDGGMDWIALTLGRDRGRAFVNEVMNIHVY
jgi:hypothetical protein